MSYWLCCNSCFHPPSAERKLAVTTCGHVICNVCFQKGSQGKCLICNASCQVSPLSNKSSSEVKALFTDINVLATKHLTEISKVVMFQTRHQKRLLSYFQQRNEKLEEAVAKMKQEMQHMTKKLNEQSTYITKLENSLQHQSAKVSSVSQMSHSSFTSHGHKPVLQIPFNSSLMPLSRHSSVTNITDDMEVDERSLCRKVSFTRSPAEKILPNTVPRLSLISPPHAGQMGTISHKLANPNPLANHTARSATVSRIQVPTLTPDPTFSQNRGWSSPIFKPPSSFRHSMSSLVFPPP